MNTGMDNARLAVDLAEVIWNLGARGLDGICCEGLSLVEHRTLGRLAGGPLCTVQGLGEEAGLTKSGATRLVDRMEQRKLLRRERSAVDGRVCCVELTSAGREALEQANEAFTARLTGLMQNLPIGQREQVSAAVPVLAAALRRENKDGCC